MSSSKSRRQFLRYSAGTAALVVGEGCAFRGSSAVHLRSATMSSSGTQGSAAPSEADLVVKPTPSLYFVGVEPGSREMKFGPVKDYGEMVPNDRFYVHSRARPPSIDIEKWRLEIAGDALARPRSLSLAELKALPQVTVRRTLDCGANFRAFFSPLPGKGTGWLPIGFTQWHYGAVGAAEWTGVRVRDVLETAGLGKAVEVMFTGLDSIPGWGSAKAEPYAHAMPIESVIGSDALLVHQMNGAPLPIDHGYPLRLLISGWGGNTAVKWIGRIEASTTKMERPTYQARQLIYGPDIPTAVEATVGRVRSALEVDAGVTLTPGDIVLHGRAWSGSGAIDRVDVSIEKLVAPNTWRPVWNEGWREAQLLGKPEALFWTRFAMSWPGVQPGRYRVMTRARDAARNVQPRPEDVVWNQVGLGYNGHAPLEIAVMPVELMP